MTYWHSTLHCHHRPEVTSVECRVSLSSTVSGPSNVVGAYDFGVGHVRAMALAAWSEENEPAP